MLRGLIEAIGQYELAIMNEMMLWSKIYEHLIQPFPEKKGISLYAPDVLIQLMMELIKPDVHGSFYDPASASGCLRGLVKAAVEKQGTGYFIGQDKESVAQAVVKMDLLPFPGVTFCTGNALEQPLVVKRCTGEEKPLRRFQYIFANPPWKQSTRSSAVSRKDPWKRFDYGIPPRNSADWAWVQHILATLEEGGQAAVLLDVGALSRDAGRNQTKNEQAIRSALVEKDVIETVVVLPGKLFYGTMASCCLILLNTQKPEDRKGAVLFIRAWNVADAQCGLDQEKQQAIIEAHERWETQVPFCRVVNQEEIQAAHGNLNPFFYLPEESAIPNNALPVLEKNLVARAHIRRMADEALFHAISHVTGGKDTEDTVTLLETLASLSKGQRSSHAIRAPLSNTIQARQQELLQEEYDRDAVLSAIFLQANARSMSTLTAGEQVPPGWKIERLEACAEVSGGFTPLKAERKREGERVPWVKTRDLEGERVSKVPESVPASILTHVGAPGALDRSFACTVKIGMHPLRARRPKNTLLLALYGGPGTVGKTALLAEPAVTNQSVCCIRPFEEKLDTDYLFGYLIFIRKSWLPKMGGARLNLNLQTVGDQLIPYPSLKQQKEIAKRLQPHNERIYTLKFEIARLKQFRRR